MSEPDRIRALIALIIVLGFLSVLGAWFVFPLKGDPQLFNVMLGTLGSGGFMVVVGYYFGSSSGSKSKDEALSRIAAANVNGNAVVEPVSPKVSALPGGKVS